MQKIVNTPEELKKLNLEELDQQALLIREFLIDNISKTGGHIGSNLGVVELTLAMHYSFDSPNDKLIFDVGHQAYVHKILTNRQDKFSTLRQFNGLSGFIKHSESNHDVWEAGHAATSISAAAGFAWARDLEGLDNHVIALIGDGSLTNGMAIEALNHLIELNSKVIIVVNDNEMSISNNIGFINNIFKDIKYSIDYKNTKLKVRGILRFIPFGFAMSKGISKIKSILNRNISNNNLFTEMGYEFVGTVDGHDIEELNSVFEYAKLCDNSIVIHIKTKKGMGYEPAMKNSWHGISPFDPKTGELLNKKTGSTYSSVVSKRVEQLMEKDEDIVVITPAMLGGSELDYLNEKFPNRVTDVGIAEEHALTFAAGLSVAGKKPFVAIYSTFLQRAYDQVFHDICRINASVVIGVDRAGLVGDDGETHQGIYDISFLSHMPNMTIVQGKNAIETIELVSYAFNLHEGPIAIRYPRGGNYDYEAEVKNISDITTTNWIHNLCENNIDKVVITYGELVGVCEEIFRNENVGIVNARFINILDHDVMSMLASTKIYIIEEHASIGGLGSLIAHKYNNYNLNYINLGLNFVEQGNVDVLREEYNLSGSKIYEQIIGTSN